MVVHNPIHGTMAVRPFRCREDAERFFEARRRVHGLGEWVEFETPVRRPLGPRSAEAGVMTCDVRHHFKAEALKTNAENFEVA